MTAKAHATVTMSTASGGQFRTWESFTLRDSFMDPLGDFQFTARPSAQDRAAFAVQTAPGETVRITIDQHPQAQQLVETRRRTVDERGVSFDLTCRSPLSVAFKASCDPEISKHLSAATPISELVLEALAPYRYTRIASDESLHVNILTGKALDKSGADIKVQELKAKDLEATENETAYGFASRMFQRLGVALRTRWNGELLLCAPNFDQSAAYVLIEDPASDGAGDRMLSGFQLAESIADSYSEVVVRGGSSDEKDKKSTSLPIVRVAVEGAPDAAPAVHAFSDIAALPVPAGPHSYRSTAQPYKPRFLYDKLATDGKTATNRAKRILARAAEHAYELTCTVEGLKSASGRIWTVDTIARVRSKALGLDLEMWVSEVTKKCDRRGGQTTELKLIPKGCLVLGDLP